MIWGLVAGTALGLLELPQVPAKLRRWVPSSTGIGLGLILPFQYPLAMLIGAVGAALWQRRDAEQAERYLVPLAAGIIAGISLMGVAVAVLNSAFG
jgi:uncharacterized oligopeptide transporter (OPT) family protein